MKKVLVAGATGYLLDLKLFLRTSIPPRMELAKIIHILVVAVICHARFMKTKRRICCGRCFIRHWLGSTIFTSRNVHGKKKPTSANQINSGSWSISIFVRNIQLHFMQANCVSLRATSTIL